MENNRSNENVPRYVEVYNRILKNIKEGFYNEENKLPNEIKLAEQMGVSRMTLRKSLLLLQEDGIIESRKGVGNFLCNQSSISTGLEQAGEVLEKCGIYKIDRVTCSPKLGTTTLYCDDVFERKVPIVLGANLYYFFEKTCYAHCFSIIPTDVDFIAEYDLLDAKHAERLIRYDIYKYAKVVKFEMKIVEDSENFINNGTTMNSQLIFLVIEKMIDDQGKVICLNKYHIPVEYVNIRVNAFKK